MANLECGGNPLVSELARALELATQLGAQLEQPSSSSLELCKSLAAKIFCSTEKSIAMAKLLRADRELPPDASAESPLDSCTQNLQSEISDQLVNHLDHKELPKKRKTLPKWRGQVRVSSVGGLEGPLEDGHSWRKYGQKNILGAKFPRGYYRCTYRNSQGCPATKQIQRTDSDPSAFDIIYQGTHICIQKPSSSKKQELLQEWQGQQDLLQVLEAGLAVETEGLTSEPPQDCRPPVSFSFPSTPASSLTPPECNPFSSSLAPDDCRLAGFSPSFASPATPQSNYFSFSACQTNVFGGDLAEVVSAATSMTGNSPVADLDFIFDDLQFGADFHIDPSSFLS